MKSILNIVVVPIICLAAIVCAPPAGAAEPVVAIAVIHAPVAKAWDAFTTKEGLESWMCAHASMDLRVGGLMRTHYDPKGSLGDGGTIENVILSLDPQRMISMRIAKAPDKFPFKNSAGDMWSVIYFDAVDDASTRITIRSMGFRDESEESMKMRDFFAAGNAYTLEELKKHFLPDAAGSNPTDDASTVMQRMAVLAGGEWIYENTQPDGKVFRTRSVIERGPDGECLVSKGWLGDASGMFLHGVAQIWREPIEGSAGRGGVRFQSIDQGGAMARGAITPDGDKGVMWDWNSVSKAGKAEHYQVKMTFDTADSYHFVLNYVADGAVPKELVNIVYRRVTESPEAFRKMKAVKMP